MTLEDIKKLSDRELDALLAEKVLGWHRWDGLEDWGGPDGETIFYVGEMGLEVYEEGAEDVTRRVSFSQSLDAIAPLEAKCVEKVGLMQYADVVRDAVGRYIFEQDLLFAPARNRAEAVLYCWEGE